MQTLTNDDFIGNLMHQSADKSSSGASSTGNSMAIFQFKRILKYHNTGRLNQGKQSYKSNSN